MLSIFGCLQVFAMYLMKIPKSSLHAPVADQVPVCYQVSYHIIYSLHDYNYYISQCPYIMIIL